MMAKRKGATQHYERLFENELRKSGVLYLAIDETKKPIYEDRAVKNFDFIVSSFNGKFLIDIKGKKFPYGKRGFWENWIRTEDISGLKLWATHFNAFIPSLFTLIFLWTNYMRMNLLISLNLREILTVLLL